MSGEHHKLLAPPALAVAHTASGVTEIVRDVRDLVGQASPVDDELVAAAVRGWSHNTRRAFRSDLIIWGERFRRRRLDHPKAQATAVAPSVRVLDGIDPSAVATRAMDTHQRYMLRVCRAYRMAGTQHQTDAPPVRL